MRNSGISAELLEVPAQGRDDGRYEALRSDFSRVPGLEPGPRSSCAAFDLETAA
ncbi:MAG: hypothetical protein AAFN79_14390 [Pseudomonadota bacterium]